MKDKKKQRCDKFQINGSHLLGNRKEEEIWNFRSRRLVDKHRDE